VRILTGCQAGAGGQPGEERCRHLGEEAPRAGHISPLGKLMKKELLAQ
jgi:hypothetical protein